MIDLTDTPPSCDGGTCAPVTVEIGGLVYYTGECRTADELPCSSDFNDDSAGWESALAAAEALANANNASISAPACPEGLRAEVVGEYDFGLFILRAFSGKCVKCVIPIWNGPPDNSDSAVIGFAEGKWIKQLQICSFDRDAARPECANGQKAEYIGPLDLKMFDRQPYFVCQGQVVAPSAQPTPPVDYIPIPPEAQANCYPPNILSRETDGTFSCYSPCGDGEVFDHNDKLCGCAPGRGRQDGTPSSPCVKKEPPVGQPAAGRVEPSSGMSTGKKVAIGLAVVAAIGIGAWLINGGKKR